jgi:hypothetical protein
VLAELRYSELDLSYPVSLLSAAQAALLVLDTAAAGTGGIAPELWAPTFDLAGHCRGALVKLLLKDSRECRVQFGMLALHHPWPFKEVFRGHGEELGLVGQPVGIDI